MAWDILSGAAKMAWDVLSGVTKTAWDVLSRVANRCGMFCPGCQKMAWDVLSRDVLSYILLRMLQGEHSAILSTVIMLPFVIKIFVLSIFEWLLKTCFIVLTTYMYFLFCGVRRLAIR